MRRLTTCLLLLTACASRQSTPASELPRWRYDLADRDLGLRWPKASLVLDLELMGRQWPTELVVPIKEIPRAWNLRHIPRGQVELRGLREFYLQQLRRAVGTVTAHEAMPANRWGRPSSWAVKLHRFEVRLEHVHRRQAGSYRGVAIPPGDKLMRAVARVEVTFEDVRGNGSQGRGYNLTSRYSPPDLSELDHMLTDVLRQLVQVSARQFASGLQPYRWEEPALFKELPVFPGERCQPEM